MDILVLVLVCMYLAPWALPFIVIGAIIGLFFKK